MGIGLRIWTQKKLLILLIFLFYKNERTEKIPFFSEIVIELKYIICLIYGRWSTFPLNYILVSSAQSRTWVRTWLQGCDRLVRLECRKETASRVSQRRRKCPDEESLLRPLLWEREAILVVPSESPQNSSQSHTAWKRKAGTFIFRISFFFFYSFLFFLEFPTGVLIPWQFSFACIKTEGWTLSSLLWRRPWVRKMYCLFWMWDADGGREVKSEHPLYCLPQKSDAS